MYFEKRGTRYSFIYHDPERGKNVRLRKHETPAIENDEQARDFCKKWDARLNATAVRIHRRLEWQTQFHDFTKLLKTYELSRMEEAPHSWTADRYYLEYYVFPFFLEKKKAINISLWKNYFEEFRDYLLVAEPLKIKKGQNSLAYATKNNIIKALNAFLLVMFRRKEIEHLEKCRYFPKSKVNRKNEESVIPEEKQIKLFEEIRELNSSAAILFWVTLQTGLRLSEALGLSLSDFFPGELENEALKRALQPYQMKPFGYLAIDSQPKNALRPRNAKGEVLRKPLKNKKRITNEEGRIIPIFDRTAYNHLVGLWNAQQFLFARNRFGANPKNYLLFDGINKNIYANVLRTAQKRLRWTKRFTAHDTRHTYSTWLAEQTGGNYMLCRMILGHASLDITMRYVHLSAQIHKNLRITTQLKTQLEQLG